MADFELKLNEDDTTLESKTFVCGIGAQKAGTTFLADYLSNHPQFFMSDLKELHYFDAKFLPKLSGMFEVRFQNKIKVMIEKLLNGKNINSRLLIALIKRIEASKKDNYKSYFEYYVREKHLAFGEITPAYSMLKQEHFQEIVSLFPNHKFIFLLRNPADRFWSQINYEIQSKKNNTNPLSIIDECFKRKDYILRSDYRRTMSELSSVVSQENICIEFYENIFSKKKGMSTMKKISDFIGIDFHKNLLNQNKKINTTDYKAIMTGDIRKKIVWELEDTYKFIYENYSNIPKTYLNDISKYLNNFKEKK